MAHMAQWLDALNDAQRRAVEHGDGPLLVIAGAGTGKTRTLACRVAALVERGVAPEAILLLTFTRRAAREMLRRAGSLIGSAHAGKVWGGTFHATANRLLRQYGRSIGLAAEFTVIDQSDAADVINLVRGELGLGNAAPQRRRFPRKSTLMAIYSRMVNARMKLADLLETHYPWCADEIDRIRAVFEAYTKRKREQNVLDYDDLLLYWKALVDLPGVGDPIAGRFDHVLVDEYQDTNLVQAQILQTMRRTNGNITVVGDDAQSIYSFRAATVRNILDFPQQFPGATTITLDRNYRSTQPILDASNAVMVAAGERYTKDLHAVQAGGDKPAIVTCVDETDQCDQVCTRIIEKLEEGIPLKQQAVLFRAGHHSDALEVELTRRNVPFVKYGGLKFVEAAHVKDMIAICRLLTNPTDELSWYRVLQLLEGVGPATAQKIIGRIQDARPARIRP
jgi:DNA helicase-2/ATP-dependent DNA helicase PcrA